MSTTPEGPETGVTNPREHDVICGRGGAALRHPGNLAYRKLVNLNKGLYATCLKAEKLRISKSIVAAIREVKGRFLEREDGKISTTLDEKDENGNPVTWRDIGDKRAIEKTSQALREGQPKLLKKLKEMSGEVTPQAVLPPQGHTGPAPNNFGPQMNFNNSGNFGGDVMNPQFGSMNQAASLPSTMMHPPLTVTGHGPSQSMPSMPGNQPLANFRQDSHNSTYPHNSAHSHHATPLGNFGGPDMKRGSDTSLEFEPNNFHAAQQNFQQSNFHNSQQNWHDSWAADPAPLHGRGQIGSNFVDNIVFTHEQIFSPENQEHLLSVLNDEKSVNSKNRGSLASFSIGDEKQSRTSLASFTVGSMADDLPKDPNRRPSVQFSVPERPNLAQIKTVNVGFGDSVRSLQSHLSDLSMLETHSLDSALDAFERESEMSLLGEFEDGYWEKYVNAVEEAGEHVYDGPPGAHRSFERREVLRSSFAAKPVSYSGQMVGEGNRNASGRRSILRGSMRYSQNAFPSATVTETADPGMIFTSTFDTKRGGINAGTDVSGLLTDRRKSAVAFDVSTTHRMSLRASMRMSGVSGMFMRDGGSGFYSIQSADIRELMDLSDDEEEDGEKK